MQTKPATLQVCVSCKRARDRDTQGSDIRSDGQKLYDGLRDAFSQDNDLNGVALQAVECMNNCDAACTVAFRADDKFNFVVGALEPSDAHVSDLGQFAKSFLKAEDGLPPWRERPVHIRKNTLARLHPISNRQQEPTKA